ncbi:MAG: diguanylate cyclase [Gudongella sp.]|nr:diguanylate cyclase [Gudongella sp.]
MDKKILVIIDEKLREAKEEANMDPDRSMKLCNEAFNMAVKSNHHNKIGDCYIGMAFVARTRSDKSNILDYSFKALREYEKMESSEGISKAFNLIGVAYFYSAMYEEAIRYFLDGLEKLEKTYNPSLCGSLLNNIGEVYRESGLYDKALEYYEKAYELSERNNLEYYLATILGNMGEVYLIKDDYSKALEYLMKSYGILEAGKDLVSMGEVANKIGKAQQSMGNTPIAVKYFKLALRILDRVDNQFYRIDVLSNLAHTKKDPEETIAILKDAISTALGVGAKKKLSDLYQQVSIQYENIMDFRTALSYHKKFFLINQEIMNSNIRNKLEILNVEIRHLEVNDRLDQVKRTLEKELEENRKELEAVRRSNIILEREAFEDELTEIPNRRSVNLQLKRLLSNYRGENSKIAVFILDIDNFKEYNDYWGHSEGDRCLKEIAKALQTIARKSGDMVGRYGGEEFVFISKASKLEEAVNLGNFIRNRIRELDLKYDHNENKDPVSISIGGVFGKIVEFREFSQVMELADRELYRAKADGRNRSYVASL